MENKNKKTTISKTMVIFTLLILISGVVTLIALIEEERSLFSFFFILTILLVLVALILLIMGVVFYNRLIKNKNKIDESLSLIDVYLKMRFDLVPNLVRTVKGYMQHEKGVLKQITLLRKKSLTVKDDGEKINLSNQLAAQMKSIFVTIEDYPELKSDKPFLVLMEQLRDIENKISASRRFYNANINAYNNNVQTFPARLVAKKYGFEIKKPFKIEVNEKILPTVFSEVKIEV